MTYTSNWKKEIVNVWLKDAHSYKRGWCVTKIINSRGGNYEISGMIIDNAHRSHRGRLGEYGIPTFIGFSDIRKKDEISKWLGKLTIEEPKWSRGLSPIDFVRCELKTGLLRLRRIKHGIATEPAI